MAAMPMPLIEVQTMGQDLAQRTVCVKVRLGRLGNTRKVSNSQVEVDTDKSLIRVSKHLLDSNELRTIANFDGEIRRYLYDTCLPFEAGIHLCPLALLEQMEGKLREFAVRRKELIDAFLTAYPALCQEAAKRLRSLYNPADYPPLDYVAQQFTLIWQYISFGVPDQLREISTKIWHDEREKAAEMMAEAGREIQQVLGTAMAELVMDFIGRHLKGFFDYGIADEVHELKGDTAQGAALGTIASCAQRTVILTGTLNGGYADELYNILFRLNPRKMLEEGFAYGDAGMRAFSEAYGVLEKVTTITPADNACSDKPKVTTRVRRRPGASPLLFGRFLMELGAFVSLEDISDALPSYEEEVLSVEMDVALGNAYKSLEEDIKAALEKHHGNQSVVSTGLNALMLYPDRPFQLGTLYGYATDPDSGERERFVISDPADLDENVLYAKERRLIEEVKAELCQGRRCQIYAVYTQKRNVTQRLKNILSREGMRVEVLTTAVPPEAREAWYERQVKAGMQVCVAHPRLVATGLDLLQFPTLLFYESGYSIYVLRQASRRSWRIGQKQPVRVKYMAYAGTMQENCLRLMGKKLLVSLAMEGKFANHGLQADDDDDMLTAMARELVTQKGVGEKADACWREVLREHSAPASHKGRRRLIS